MSQSMSVYSFSVPSPKEGSVSLEKYRGKVLLIVNVASKCGFTPQYEGLEALEKKYSAKGFHVLGFPCNQFGAQEPGGDAEIQSFCQLNYDVHFPVFSKIDVNGAQAHPLYEYLKKSEPGIFGTEAIKWNFTKFLVDSEGRVVKRFAPQVKPEDIASEIERLLNRQ